MFSFHTCPSSFSNAGCVAGLRRLDEAKHWLVQAAALPAGPAEDAETLDQLAKLGKELNVPLSVRN